MSSPAKKRKVGKDGTQNGVHPKSLEFFFARQRQNNRSSLSNTPNESSGVPSSDLSDEELARKLQAEWNQEVENGGYPDQAPNSSLTAHVSAAEPERIVTQPEPGPLPPTSHERTSPMASSTLILQSNGTAEDSVVSNIPLDESPLVFEPSKYIETLRHHWEAEGGDASYAFLTRCFVLVSATASRIKIVDTLVNCLRILIEGDPSSLLPAVWLATNSISPAYISLELGLGGSAISKALKQVCGLDSRSLKSLYNKYGDAGDVAFEAKKKQSFTLRKPKPLTIKGVYQALVKIASSQGQGSAEIKQRIVDRLLQDARGGEESRFVVRTLCQHLRIGAVKTTMLIALSRAFLLSRPPGSNVILKQTSELSRLRKDALTEVWGKAEEIVKACFARRPNYNDLIPALLEIGISDELLIRCSLKLHAPLRPMLGSITRDLSEMLTKLQGRDFACEWKYDGQRAQIHCDAQGKVSIFSRHLELMTGKYPDLVHLIPKIRSEGVRSFIMEGEVVAINHCSGELKSFQTLTNRARKDVDIGTITVGVCFFAFDLMYLNEQPLLDSSFRERRELLKSLFTEVPRRFTWVTSLDATSSDSETVLEFFKSATENKCEGIMVKILDNLANIPYTGEAQEVQEVGNTENLSTLNKDEEKAKNRKKNGEVLNKRLSTRRKPLLATYEPDKRLDCWLKVKKDYSSSFETLDLIPIAGWHGQGRKAKWWSPVLLAVRNDETGMLEAVCKCISGFTDAFYKSMKQFYDDGGDSEEPRNTRAQKPGFIDYRGPVPDVWFEPQEVWEMAFADITLSPTYTAAKGLVSEERGLSLRFPRFLKRRDDKSLEEASTNDFLAGLWRKQEDRTVTAPVKEPLEDDGQNDAEHEDAL